MKKVLSIILTAAILLTTACSDNNTSSVNSQNSTISNSSGGVTDNTTSSMVVENTPNKVDDTLPQCEPANIGNEAGTHVYNRIMKGTDGYYYSQHPWEYRENATEEMKVYYYDEMPLYYYDTETGKSIILCSKPQCLHDGNEFCAATSSKGLLLYNCLYNGYIYKINLEDTEVEGHSVLRLSRADLQGNELSTIGNIMSFAGKSPDIHGVIFHYGKMFISATIYNDTKKGTKHIYVTDLESGEVKEINVPDAQKYETYAYMTADGDYLYYATEDISYNKINNYMIDTLKTVTHRYNIKTGETEILSAMPEVYSSFTVNNGIVYYTVVDGKNDTFCLYSYDTVKDEKKTFVEDKHPKYTSGKYLSGQNSLSVFTDRKYLYIITSGRANRYNEEVGIYSEFYIYDFDGKMLYEGVPGIDPDKEWWEYVFSAIDGNIYIYYNISDNSDALYFDEITGLYTIKTEDLINGKTDWTRLYKTSSHSGGMN